MTRGEFLSIQRDWHLSMALKKKQSRDTTGVTMHLNVARSLQMRLQNMTIAELRSAM
ncbi:MAG: hypothetical protein ACTTKX_03640 [Treponema sp.]